MRKLMEALDEIDEIEVDESIVGDTMVDIGRKMTNRVTQKAQIHRMAMMAFQEALALVDLNLKNDVDADKVMPKIRDTLLTGIRNINPKKK